MRKLLHQKPYVIHVIQSLGAGGAERLVVELVSRLPDKGYEAKLLTITASGPLEADVARRHISLFPIVHRSPFGLRTLFDLIRLFRREQPDIVHTHLFTADVTARLAAFLARVPHIFSTEHNVNPSYSIFKKILVHHFAAVTDAYVSVSEEVRRVMITQDRIPAEKVHTILPGIDIANYPQRSARGFYEVPRLIVIGRLEPQKDHATLFKALAQLRRPWFLQVVGEGSCERDLRALAERLHIAARIEWLGFRDDVPQLLADADVCCFSSAYEGLGLVALEAAAAGVPLVVSDLPPLHEVFRKTEVRFVSPGEVIPWSRALQEILDSPVESLERARRLAARVRRSASIDEMVEKYAELYDGFIKVTSYK